MVAISACDAPEPARAPTRTLPPYAGAAVKLFDDGIESRALLPFNLEERDAVTTDNMRRERVQRADAVLEVRVTTITSKQEDAARTYEIGFKTTSKLAGANPPPTDFVVTAGRMSPSLGLLRDFETRLVGTKFVAFLSSFAGSDADGDLHFHLAPDTKDELEAIRSAGVMNQFTTHESK